MTHSPAWPAFARRACLALLAAAALGLAPAAFAQPASPVHADAAWIRWLPAGLPAGGYMTLHNDSDRAVALVGASSPDYGQTMLHHSVMKDGTMQMLPVRKVEVPAHGVLRFQPGGYHIMLMQPKHDIHPGDQVPVTLRFADGERLHVQFEVRKPGASGAMPPMGGMDKMPMPQQGH